jgi:BlaI family penicillinase repressor
MSNIFDANRIRNPYLERTMARRQSRTAEGRALTDVEWVIMETVWEHEPCAAGTVQEALQTQHGWAYSTVKTTMDRMVAKGLLATKSIRNLQLFSSAISRDDARRVEVRKLLKRAFDGALTPMIQFLVEKEGLSATEIKELRGLLDAPKRRKE